MIKEDIYNAREKVDALIQYGPLMLKECKGSDPKITEDEVVKVAEYIIEIVVEHHLSQ